MCVYVWLICVCPFVCLFVCLSACLPACVNACLDLSVCMDVCMYLCMYVCHVYTYIHADRHGGFGVWAVRDLDFNGVELRLEYEGARLTGFIAVSGLPGLRRISRVEDDLRHLLKELAVDFCRGQSSAQNMGFWRIAISKNPKKDYQTSSRNTS